LAAELYRESLENGYIWRYFGASLCVTMTQKQKKKT
jgi:hypothetical protein